MGEKLHTPLSLSLSLSLPWRARQNISHTNTPCARIYDAALSPNERILHLSHLHLSFCSKPRRLIGLIVAKSRLFHLLKLSEMAKRFRLAAKVQVGLWIECALCALFDGVCCKLTQH
jgi:hypothetical protein